MKNKFKKINLLFSIFLLTSALTFSEDKGKEANKTLLTTNISSEETRDEIDYFKVYDPWERRNRQIYYFNYYFDKIVLKPIVSTYNFITPEIIQEGVGNFYTNSQNVGTMVNSVAQGKMRKFMRTLGRFSMNSIIGVFGIFDVATKLDMPKEKEDLGLTLAHYGVGPGPYVIIPVLGPSNLRDALSSGIGYFTYPTINPYTVTNRVDMNSLGIRGLEVADTRKKIKFNYYEMGTPFEYEYLRFFYSEVRKMQENSK